MANTTIQIKKSATPAATPSVLANGELAINYADGKLFYKAANGTILSITSGTSTNSFSTVNANGTLVVADSPTNVLTIVPGNNITVVGDAVNDKVTVGLTNDVTIPGVLFISPSSGDEGGELRLATAVTNSTLSGPSVVIDIYQNKLRFFENGGAARGAFINLAATAAGVGTDLLATGSSAVDTVARTTASAAFDKANAALPNTNGVTFAGILTVSANLNADKVIATNNGLGENFRVGDDAWIGDFNVANSIKLKGYQNASVGYISFGMDDGTALGRAGTGNLTYGGNTVWHAGNDGAGSGLDADLLDGQQGSYYGIATDVTAAFNRANTSNSVAIANVNYVNTAMQAAFSVANAAVTTTTLSGANSAVGTAANNYAAAIGTAGNTYFLTTIAGANSAVGAGANTVGSAAFAAANVSSAIAVAAYANANSKFSSSGGTINGDVQISGNLSVTGNTIWTNVSTFIVNDPLIYLAGNNYSSDIVDIGFVANYVNATGSNVHTGLFRDAGTKEYYVFEGYNQEPYNNVIDTAANGFTISVLNATLRTSNIILGGVNAISWIRSSYDTANNIGGAVTTANNTAIAAFTQANNVGGAVTTANNIAIAAFAAENTTRTIAVAAFDKANTGGSGGGASVAISDTAPSSPTANSLWWSSDLGKMFIYYNDGTSNQWVETSPSPDVSGVATAVTISSLSFNAANAAYNAANLALATTGGTINGNVQISGNLSVTGNTSINNFTASGFIRENVFTIADGASVDINPINGTIQLWTLGASRTPTAASFLAGQSITLMIDDGSAYTVTWTSLPVTWVGGSAPTLATTGYTIIELWKVSTTIYGALVGNA
jgi:hypothetical protein